MFKILGSAFTLCLFGFTVIGAGAPIELKCDRFAFGLAADGKPSSFKLLPENKELLDLADPGMGFAVYNKTGQKIPLCDTSLTSDNHLIASSINGSHEVVFRIHPSKTHIAFHIEHLKGFPVESDIILRFEMNSSMARAMGHNFMTEIENPGKGVTIKWPGLWERFKGDSPGGFSLYARTTDDEEDDTMLRVWAEEGLVHPKVAGNWDYETAKKWLAEWQRQFKDRSVHDCSSNLGLEDKKLDDLKKAVKYAKMANISGIYLMPWIWRGEYWPIDKTTAEINRDVFPRGEEDLRAFSDYCAKQGLHLELHWVSGGIGFHDPKYVFPKVDPRLLSWGAGKLAKPIDDTTTTIEFIPNAGTEVPYKIPEGMWGQFDEIRRPAISSVHEFNVIRVENELVSVGLFEDTDQAVWKLKNCTRGYVRSNKASHGESSEIVGLVTSYGQNLVPDGSSSLFEEIAAEYAGMLNRCHIPMALFDGIELHDIFGYNQRMKFGAAVYKYLDHPTMAVTSGGQAPWCWLEYRFNSSIKQLGVYGSPVDLRLHRDSWIASTPMDAQFACCQTVARSSRALGIRDHHCGVTLEILEKHGETKEIFETIKDWKEVEPLLTAEQCAKIYAPIRTTAHLKVSGWLPTSAVVHVLKDGGSDWRIVPTRVMTRKEGDVLWETAQEHGVMSPKQYVKPGDELQLENPYKPQAPKFSLRVIFAHDPENAENIALQPTLSEIKNLRDTGATTESQALVLSYDNKRAQALWEEADLPQWPKTVDMTGHRAIGMWVTGDDSKSVLVFEIPGRDYAIPINFTGRRWVDIPNGEAAWANGFWQWRFGAFKTAEYSKVNLLKLGFGMVPAQKAASVKIEDLKALKEIPTELVNPVIHVGNGSIKIEGTVASEQYLRYDGGDKAEVYDANWNKVKGLKVVKTDYLMPTGYAAVKVTSDQGKPLPWIEAQFIVEDEAMVVQKQK